MGGLKFYDTGAQAQNLHRLREGGASVVEEGGALSLKALPLPTPLTWTLLFQFLDVF